MFRLCLFFQAILFAGVYCQVTWGQDLLQIYQQAAQSDPSLKAADAERLATREIKPQAKALLLPNVVASGSWERNFNVDSESSFSSTPNTEGSQGAGSLNNNSDSFNNSRVGISLTQPLFDQEARVRVRQSESVINQAEADFLAAQQDLILRVAESYFDVLAAQDTLTAATANKSAIDRQHEQAQRRFEVGLITITDVFEAQARFDLAVADEINARNLLSNRWEALRELTGQYHDKLYRLNNKAPFEPPDPPDPDAWVNQALQTNPQLISSSFRVETARENVNLQKSGHYPTLDLKAGYFDNDTGNSETSGAQIGLELNVPIYQGGAVISRTKEAAFLYVAAKENLEATQREINRRVQDAYRGVLTTISRIKALDQARTSNASSLEATEAGFDVGTRTIVDVLNAQRELFLARRDYSVARYEYVLDYLRLLQASGQISQKHLQGVNKWLIPPEATVKSQ